MKVIFLDVDGVLNSDEYFDKIRKKNIDGIESEVDVEKIKLLKQAVIQTGAKVVLSSSWRHTKNGEQLKELLAKFEIYTDRTPYLQNKRGIEIKQWLINNENIEDFVILDDEIFDTYDDILMSKLIKVSNGDGRNFGEGLLQKDIDEIVKRFGKIKEKNVELER